MRDYSLVFMVFVRYLFYDLLTIPYRIKASLMGLLVFYTFFCIPFAIPSTSFQNKVLLISSLALYGGSVFMLVIIYDSYNSVTSGVKNGILIQDSTFPISILSKCFSLLVMNSFIGYLIYFPLVPFFRSIPYYGVVFSSILYFIIPTFVLFGMNMAFMFHLGYKVGAFLYLLIFSLFIHCTIVKVFSNSSFNINAVPLSFNASSYCLTALFMLISLWAMSKLMNIYYSTFNG